MISDTSYLHPAFWRGSTCDRYVNIFKYLWYMGNSQCDKRVHSTSADKNCYLHLRFIFNDWKFKFPEVYSYSATVINGINLIFWNTCNTIHTPTIKISDTTAIVWLTKIFHSRFVFINKNAIFLSVTFQDRWVMLVHTSNIISLR